MELTRDEEFRKAWNRFGLLMICTIVVSFIIFVFGVLNRERFGGLYQLVILVMGAITVVLYSLKPEAILKLLRLIEWVDLS